MMTSPSPNENLPEDKRPSLQEEDVEYVDEVFEKDEFTDDPWEEAEAPETPFRPIKLLAMPEGLDPRKKPVLEPTLNKPPIQIAAPSRLVAVNQRKQKKQVLRQVQMEMRRAHADKWVPSSLKTTLAEGKPLPNTGKPITSTPRNASQTPSPGLPVKNAVQRLPNSRVGLVPAANHTPVNSANGQRTPPFSPVPPAGKPLGNGAASLATTAASPMARPLFPGTGPSHPLQGVQSSQPPQKALTPSPAQGNRPASVQPQAYPPVQASGHLVPPVVVTPDAPTQKTASTANSFPSKEGTTLTSPKTVAELVAAHPDMPAFSAFLGICEDGLPLVLSLAEPDPGSILAAGDDSFANRKFLQGVVESVKRLNITTPLPIHLVSRRADRFSTLGYPVEVFAPDEETTYTMLSEHFAQVEKRLAGESAPDIELVVIDQLELILEQMADAGLSFFRWLVRRGPEVGIWTIASFTTSQTKNLDLKTLRAFGATLFGKIRKEEIVRGLTNTPPLAIATINSGEEVLFPAGEGSLLRLKLPVVSEKE